jgi:hypothetical protein
MQSTVASLIFLIISFIVVVFQLALMLGAPWGQLTLGGKYTGALPNHMRLVCLLTTVIFLAFVMVVLTRVGWILPQWFASSTQLIWAVVLYCFVGVIANALTPSRYERMLWLPAITALFASSLCIAMA